MKFAYACDNINLGLQGVLCCRTLHQKTFELKGLDFVSELIIRNIEDLQKIVEWNVSHGFAGYRIPDEIFPRKRYYEYEELSVFSIIKEKLKTLGDYCRKHNHRLSMHPGLYNVLSSTNPITVKNTVRELNQLSRIFDLMGYKADHNTKINIHVGGATGSKQEALDRFIIAFNLLDKNTQNRLTVENDDKGNMFTVTDLLYLYKKIKIPITFDYFHHSLHSGGMSEQIALETAMKTWKRGIVPVVHVSSSKKLHEDSTARYVTHADYLYEKINTYGHDIFIMVESKLKEIAVIDYKSKFLTD